MRVYLETYICGYLLTELESGKDKDCLFQTDWDYPGLAQSLGCPWRLDDCQDAGRAIEAAQKWLDDNCGEIDAPGAADYLYSDDDSDLD